MSFFETEFLKFTADFGIKPVMYLLVAIVGSLVIAAVIIMIVSRIRTMNKSKGRHEPLCQTSKFKSSTDSSLDNDGNQKMCDPNMINQASDMIHHDTYPMFDLSALSMPGPSHQQQQQQQNMGLDLELLTNSSSLYDDSLSNIPSKLLGL